MNDPIIWIIIIGLGILGSLYRINKNISEQRYHSDMDWEDPTLPPQLLKKTKKPIAPKSQRGK
jgi:hypothetical protein